jgi:uncharacterized delta-60 repeat protein
MDDCRFVRDLKTTVYCSSVTHGWRGRLEAVNHEAVCGSILKSAGYLHMKAKLKIGRRLRTAQIQSLENRTLFSGGLDPTWGTGGYVSVPAGKPQTSYGNYAEGAVAAAQTDGKLLVATEAGNGTLEAIRFLSNGKLDTSFGSGGIAVLGQSSGPQSIAETAAGKVVVIATPLGEIVGSYVYQLTSSGKLDASFNHSGKESLPTEFLARSSAIEGDKILLAGYTSSTSPESGELLRLNANGTLDTSFGTGGFVSFGATNFVQNAIVTSNGDIAALAQPFVGTNDVVYLLNADGSKDTNFANAGAYSPGGEMTLLGAGPGGTLLIATQVGVNSSDEPTYGIARLLPTGAMDSAFSSISVPGVENLQFAVESDGSLLLENSAGPLTVSHYSSAGKLIQTSIAIYGIANQPSELVTLPSGSYIVFASPTVAFKLTAGGTLDDTFGYYGGLSALTVAQPPFAYSAIATLSNRKVIVAGIAFNGVNDLLEVARYNVNGSLDTSFGSGGIVQTGFGELGAEDASLLIQPDGKIVAAVSIGPDPYLGDQPTSSAIVRYNSNGSLDTTFGKAGIVSINGDAGIVAPVGDNAPVVLWQDNKLLIGTSTTLYRYNTNGALDSAFAKGLPGGEAFAVQPDGKIIVNAATYYPPSGDSLTTVYRYTQNGGVDTTFGMNGVVTSDDGDQTITPVQIVVEPGGTIVLANTVDAVYSFYGNAELVAMNANGSVDSAFGSAGTIAYPQGTDDLVNPSLIEQPNGQLLFAVTQAQSDAFSPAGETVLVSRYSPTGQLDTTFGTNGIAFVGSTILKGDFRPTVFPTVTSTAALDSAGRLLFVGGIGPVGANIAAIDTNNDTGTITGYMFYDFNGNGKRDPGDHQLNWTCYIDVDNDGHYDNADIRIYTDATGNFVIPNLAPGVYHIRQSQVSHWQKTTAAEFTVTVTAGETVTGIAFGSREIAT